MNVKIACLGAMSLTLSLPSATLAFPLDGYPETGIRRLESARLTQSGELSGSRLPPGALLNTDDIDLRLLAYPDLELPPPDPKFTAQIRALLGAEVANYGIAVLDLSDPTQPRYAEYRGDHRQNVGSVGKLAVVLALFQAMADIWPTQAAREQLLQTTWVTADTFSQTDHHTVRLFDVDARKLTRRTVHVGDRANLWEWMDWMLSASSNAAAGMVMREVMLMRQYGEAYPPAAEEAQRFFRETGKSALTALFERSFYEPLSRNGFDLEAFRQGSFFTHYGKKQVPGPGSSYATARALMLYGLRLEQGRLVDLYSSRQIKRLLYLTERRIRYASSPRLADSAVYFKSGSLYSCQKEPGFSCGKYKGNVKNYMNSFAIVESPAHGRRLHYLVTLISNVLRRNSAVDHQTLASRIHSLIGDRHPGVVNSNAPATDETSAVGGSGDQ